MNHMIDKEKLLKNKIDPNLRKNHFFKTNLLRAIQYNIMLINRYLKEYLEDLKDFFYIEYTGTFDELNLINFMKI